MAVKNIMIVGVGGQGSLLASKLLGNLLTDEGYDVKVSEVHGMSQRGGSVVTYVKYDEKIYSPIIGKGEADIILAFEMLVSICDLVYKSDVLAFFAISLLNVAVVVYALNAAG